MGARTDGKADLIVDNGIVFTGEGQPRPGGVAIRSGKIVAVGPELRPWGGPHTELIDARGGLITPGFIDAHVHPVTGGLRSLRCSLDRAGSASEALAAVARYRTEHPGEEWIRGGGWSMEWFPGGTPSAVTLDAVTGDRPAFLYVKDGHGVWVNSAALERAGITRETPDPPDGRIERLADGSPQGMLHEGAAALVAKVLAPTPASDWENALLAGQSYLLSCGITGWQDASVEPEQEGAYLAVAGRGELVASVVAALWWDRHRGLTQIEELVARRAQPRPRYRPTSVKLMLDGIVENFSAALLEPYADSAGTGIDFIAGDELAEIVGLLDRLGFQCHFHALGSRAVRHALQALDSLSTARDLRHHLAHLQVVDPDDVDLFARTGASANLQPLWACNEPQMTELTLPFLRPRSAANQYPFATLAGAGVPLAMGSDWPVSTANVFEQTEVAVSRQHPDYRDRPPFLPEQALSLERALAAFTSGSAWVNRVEEQVGRIEVGMTADLAVSDRNPFVDPPIADTRVTHTIKSGTPVFVLA